MTTKTVNTKVKTKKVTIRHKVEQLLQDFPGARDDDKMLIMLYWNNYNKIVHNGLVNPMDVLTKSTTPETLTRARRLIQEEGKYLPTDAAVIARRSKEGKMRKAITNREVI